MTQKNLEQRTEKQKSEKGFARGFGEGMYSGVGRLGALFSAPVDKGESFIGNIREIMSKSEDPRNSPSYRAGLITGSVAGYTIVLTAGAMLNGAGLVLLSQYSNQ